jgi:hypothetical protein
VSFTTSRTPGNSGSCIVEGSDEFVGIRNAETGRLVASARVVTDYVYT